MRNNRKCGCYPWLNRWHKRQNNKEPRWFCLNCLNSFRTGRFSRFDNRLYDDICPICGAPGVTFKELGEAYKDLLEEYKKCKEKKA